MLFSAINELERLLRVAEMKMRKKDQIEEIPTENFENPETEGWEGEISDEQGY